LHEILTLVEEQKFSKLREVLDDMNPADIAEQLAEIEDDKSLVVTFRLLPKEQAAEVFSYLEPHEQQRIVEGISDRELASIVNEMFNDDAVDFTEEMPANIVKRVLSTADADTRKAINQLLKYPESSAGSLMTTELLRFKSEWTVARAIEHVRKSCMELASITYAFVTDDFRHLNGVVSMKEVLGASDEELIGDIMDTDVIYAGTLEDQEDVAERFKKYDVVSMPVVDGEMRLVGLITIDDVVDVLEDENTEDIYKMAAMAPIDDSYIETPVVQIAKKRVVWLLVLMISAHRVHPHADGHERQLRLAGFGIHNPLPRFGRGGVPRHIQSNMEGVPREHTGGRGGGFGQLPEDTRVPLDRHLFS